MVCTGVTAQKSDTEPLNPEDGVSEIVATAEPPGSRDGGLNGASVCIVKSCARAEGRAAKATTTNKMAARAATELRDFSMSGFEFN